jgi:hypothetical protein
MRKSSSRKVTKVSHALTQQLDMYMLAASAAALALATGTQAAAEVVYTPARQAILPLSTFSLDLNHDGTIDFAIRNNFGHFSPNSGSIVAFEPNCQKFSCENGVQYSGGYPPYAACLRAGSIVGPSNSEFWWRARLWVDTSELLGFWGDATNRYLGLRFQKDGQNYYGWARLSIKALAAHGYIVVLSGYAYESVPDKAIATGWISQTGFDDSVDDPPLPERGSLGMLALGSQGRLAVAAKD